LIRKDLLSDYFQRVAVKRLSAVEASPGSSNQHEFNGTVALRQMLGDDDRRSVPARFIWLCEEQESISVDGMMSWYDARRANATRTEYRLYYPTNDVTREMQEGDTFFLVMRRDGTFLAIIAPTGSLAHSQLVWLFGLADQPEFEFLSKDIGATSGISLDYAATLILDELGIELNEPESDALDELVEPYGTQFPTTREFSALARSSLKEVDPAVDDPDVVLMEWMQREEDLFRRLERRIVSERLVNGFHGEAGADVDGFLKFSLSVQNRRKSRVGHALENHIEAMFLARKVLHDRGAVTENGNRPDFLFPSVEAYWSVGFDTARLTMLGAKSTLKDRWRQVLAEADRIDRKHLLTLSPALSENQTKQMVAEDVQLVVPEEIRSTYTVDQQQQFLNFNSFIELVLQRQR